MRNIGRGKKKHNKSQTITSHFYLSPDDIYTGYINKEIHDSLYKLNKRIKNT